MNHRTLAAILVVGFCVTSISVMSVAAQTDDELRKQNEDLAKQKMELTERNDLVQGQIEQNQSTVDDLATELARIDKKVNRLQAKVATEEAKLLAAQMQIVNLESTTAAKKEEILALKEQITIQAIHGYQFGERPEPAVANPTQKLRMRNILNTITETEVKDVSRLNDLLISLEEEKAIQDVLKKQIEGAKVELDADQAELIQVRAAQQVLVNKAEAQLEARLAEAAVLADRDAELAQQIQSNLNTLAARARGRGAGGGGSFSAPAPGDIVNVQGIRVHKSIATNLDQLLDHARRDGVNLAGWGYRDTQRQIELRKKHCGSSHYAVYEMSSSRCRPPTARPGASQHERGLAIDFTYNGGSIGTRRSAGYRWLAANAARYGLKNLPSEPWHWSTTGN